MGPSACGGIARDSDGRFLGAFVHFLGVSNSLIFELSGAMLVIEFVYEKGWQKTWLKSDSITVVQAFNPPFKAPWKIRIRWVNCVNIIANMPFVTSHIFREGNSCAYSLANTGLTITNYSNFNSIPNFLREDFVKHRLDFPFFWFVFPERVLV